MTPELLERVVSLRVEFLCSLNCLMVFVICLLTSTMWQGLWTSTLNHLELEFLVSDLSLGLKPKDVSEISVFFIWFPHHRCGWLNGNLIVHIQCGTCKYDIFTASLLVVWNPELVHCSWILNFVQDLAHWLLFEMTILGNWGICCLSCRCTPW